MFKNNGLGNVITNVMISIEYTLLFIRNDNHNKWVIFSQDLPVFEAPQIVTLVDGLNEDNQICVGYKNQFDLINEKNGDTLQLYQIESSKVR